MVEQMYLQGSYREMGEQQGRPLKFLGLDLPAPQPRMRHFARQCQELLARFAPELLEELEGVAEAAELDHDTLLTFSLTIPFDPAAVPAPSCTVLAVLPERTVDGRLIVGRNFDFFHDESEEGATTYRTYPRGAYASLGNCDTWVGREDGLNEAGLFVAQAHMFMRGLQPGLAFWFIVRLLLDRCASVREALELIRQVPHAASWTYLLADASGQAVVVEPTVEGIALRYPQDGLLLLTNHALCPEWAGRESFVPPDSHPRYDRLQMLLGGGRLVDVDMVRAALRDHQGLVCSHGAHFRRKFGTLWSVLGRPGERQLEIAAGHPCQEDYQTVTF